DPLTARNRLLDAINRGQRAINYAGHGNVDSWRGGLFSSQDVNSLTNRGSLSVFIMMTCLNGYFHHAQIDSLAELLMKAENAGAVAVWASSGVTFPSDQGVMSIEMFRSLFDAKSSWTMGEMTQRARSAALNKDVRLTWILLGDPTTRIKR
ncbi:MAG TPA: C25 family cysteine peptidase, partial [Blastocatellia bacterium]|nr:C25 family cysteine peptidase [Blastocatellia bacterium]